MVKLSEKFRLKVNNIQYLVFEFSVSSFSLESTEYTVNEAEGIANILVTREKVASK